MDTIVCTPELPILQSSCSPDGSEGLAQLTRWQKLRNLAQTKSLLPTAAPNSAIALCGDLNAMLVASSPTDHLAAPGQSCDNLALILRQPGKLASARARTLLQSQCESTVSDSLDADLQVDAVLRKAAARAAHLAGFPKASAPSAHSKLLLRSNQSRPHEVDDQDTDQPNSAVLRDQSNVKSGRTQPSHAPLSSAALKPIMAGDVKCRPAPVNAIAKHQRIMQALTKQKLKRLSAWFAAWRALAKEAKVELLGATSMLKWRKLLRIWKAWRHIVATCQAVNVAQQQARQAHLEDIASTFHVLFRQHSILQAWHSAAQHAKHERTQHQQEAAEQQADHARCAAAVKFHDLYTGHRFWKCWVEVVQQSRAARELDLQHKARQQSIQRFVQEAVKRVQQQRGADISANLQSGHELRPQQATAHTVLHVPADTNGSTSSAQPDWDASQHSLQPSTARRSRLQQQKHKRVVCNVLGHGTGVAEMSVSSHAAAQPAQQQHEPRSAGQPVSAAHQHQSEADLAAAAQAQDQDVASSSSRSAAACQPIEDKDSSHSTHAVRKSVVRPGVLKLDEEDKSQAGSAGASDQVQPCTPLPLQASLQQQPCTPGLETVQEESCPTRSQEEPCPARSQEEPCDPELRKQPCNAGLVQGSCASGLQEWPHASGPLAQLQASGLPEQPCDPQPSEQPHASGQPKMPCASGLQAVQNAGSSAGCKQAETCSTSGASCDASGLVAENSIRFRKRSKFEALKARREEARLKAEARQREQAELERQAERLRKLEARQRQKEEAAVKALSQQLLAHQNALARLQRARTLARNHGWQPWLLLMRQAQQRVSQAVAHSKSTLLRHGILAWRRFADKEKQERASRAAAQHAAAEQHHQQALLRSLWEGLGQAVAHTRSANHDAHRHFQLCLQRQVFRQWRQVQQQEADARLLRELQLMHKASLHRDTQMTRLCLLAWAQAAAAAKEEAALEARKAHTWAKIQGWLAEETAGQSSIERTTAPDFLQDVLGPSPAADPLLASLERALMQEPLQPSFSSVQGPAALDKYSEPDCSLL